MARSGEGGSKSGGGQPASVLLTAYTVSVYAERQIDDASIDIVLDEIESELHADLFRLASRLEQEFPVTVVAIDEAGAGWIAGGLGYRPELGRQEDHEGTRDATSPRRPGGEPPPSPPARP